MAKLRMWVEVIGLAELAQKSVTPIPEVWARCYKCPRPAVDLVCMKVAGTELAEQADKPYSEAAANAIAQALRSEFDTDFELPCCEEHEHEGNMAVQ